jgi:pimeloyl-ACP methyl ester carboxylesterase
MIESSVPLNGLRIHYVEQGTGSAVLLIHGIGPASSWRVWQANIDALATQRRVIALDLPGYGDSPAPPDGVPTDVTVFSQVYAQVVHDFMQRMDVPRAALAGLSAGGGVALHIATQWPTSVEKLVLVDSSGGAQSERWKAITVPTLLVWQREDQIIPLAHGQKLHEAIPNSRLEVLEGNAAGIEPYGYHWPQALNPQRFNELVLEFLRD